MKQFSDHFSGHAGSYAAHRPVYPQELFERLATECESRALAWDCATGNGQAARSLIEYFDKVVATDASEQQIHSAPQTSNIEYRVARAEGSGLADDSVDLITVAQALHWFDIEAFFREAQRVLKPGGILAFWCYQNCVVDDDVDAVVLQLFDEVEDYWPPEREIVEAEYPTIVTPFEDFSPGEFCIVADWSAAELLNYMRTWSASQRYLAEKGADPIDCHADALHAAWGEDTRSVKWPIILRVGRKA